VGAQLTKSGVLFKRLGSRRCWPVSDQLPGFLPFTEIVSVSTRQNEATLRCCDAFCKGGKVILACSAPIFFTGALECNELQNIPLAHEKLCISLDCLDVVAA
jgi:hypothetical protein